jgi:hypothetical protein
VAGQRSADDGRDRVDRGTDRQVDDPAGMPGGQRLVLGDAVPGEVRE